MTTTLPLDNPPALWTFSVERYTQPGVRAAAIALQEALGADVNLLFFCVWHATTGRGRLGMADFERVEMRIAHWRDDVTLPLRRLRTRIKNDPDLAGLRDALDARSKILDAEVESERVAQIAIESTARPPSGSGERSLKEIAAGNLRTYLAHIDAEIDAVTERHLSRFLNGVFS